MMLLCELPRLLRTELTRYQYLLVTPVKLLLVITPATASSIIAWSPQCYLHAAKTAGLDRETMTNRRFPEITGKDNLTVFSYSGRVKSPEWRRQLRRADLQQFYIFRHGPIIIYTRLQSRGTYYPICTFPTNSERLIGISDAFSAFVYGYPSSCPRAHCTPSKSVPTLRYTRRHGPT